MGTEPALKTEPASIVACTISRDVQQFDLLIDDMEAELGEAWGDLQLGEARSFFAQPEAADLKFVAIAVDAEDEGDIGLIGEIIRAATERKIKVILIADNVSTAGLHQLLKLGAHDFVPYPLPENALHDAIERVTRPEPEPMMVVQHGGPSKTGQRMGAPSALFAVQKLAGGAGATSLAVNLAWELAKIDKEAPSVCVIDFDLQQGAIATYLDLPRREFIIEILSDTVNMDEDSFRQALQTYGETMSVFTAPAEIVPLDMLTAEDVERILEVAKASFDIVVVDMPGSIVTWTETVLARSDVFFAVMELDMRSAQNAMRFIKALQSEDLPLDKVNFCLNRAPGMTDLNGKARVKRLAESLGVKISTQLADGGKQVVQTADHGAPLAEMAKKNAFRRDIHKLAVSLHEAMVAEIAKSA
ncbi:AAA family ATPase [Rhodobacterales bacterium HKCCE3408]|nr:AAA family ATPase [Rhodobacterales bacterium HKCCE3408]